jgi:hypothetical protein
MSRRRHFQAERAVDIQNQSGEVHMTTQIRAWAAATQRGDEKWAALIDDVVVPAPRRILKVSVLKIQARIGNEFALVRDHNSPNDVVLGDDDEIDLANGNVFYKLLLHEVGPRDRCTAPPKLAYFVSDQAEVSTTPDLTGGNLRQLFNLPSHVDLLRDFESPRDVVIANDDAAYFTDGPVFIARNVGAPGTLLVATQVLSRPNTTFRFHVSREASLLDLMREGARRASVALLPPTGRPLDLLHNMRCDEVGPSILELGQSVTSYIREPLHTSQFGIALVRAFRVNTRWAVAPAERMTPREILALPEIALDHTQFTLYRADGSTPLPLDVPIPIERGDTLEAQRDGKYGGSTSHVL